MNKLKMKINIALSYAAKIMFVLLIFTVSSCFDDGFNNAIDLENSGLAGATVLLGVADSGSGSDTDWINIDAIATPRSGTAMAELDGWLYFYGGEDMFGYSDHFWRYDPGTGDFEVLSGHDKIAYATLSARGGILYLIGGVTKSGAADVYLNTVLSYNPSSATWTDLTPASGDPASDDFDARAFHTAVVHGNDIYVHGGFGPTLLSSGPVIHRGHAYQFDVITGKWTTRAEGPQRKNAAAASAVIGNKMYFFGGYGRNDLFSPYETKNELWRYDVSADEWTLLGTLAGAEREGAALEVIDDILYLFGGENAGASLNDVWKYNPGTSQWNELTIGPGARSYMSSAVSDGKFVIFGGYDLVDAERVYKSEVWTLTP